MKKSGAVINQPSHIFASTNPRVQGWLRQKIDAVPAGDHIRVSIFIFTNTDTEDALSNALTRGVSVTVLSENREYVENANQQAIIDRLIVDGATAPFCFNSCHGTHINHDKVVFTNEWAIVSSCNLSNGSKYEAACYFEKTEAPLVYSFIENRFDEQVNATTTASFKEQYEGKFGVFNAGPTTFNFYADWISKMDYAPGARLEIVMGHWDDFDDSQAIITELRKAQKKGIDVNALFGDTYDAQLHVQAHATETGTEAPFSLEHQTNIHAKFMNFYGIYDGSPVPVTRCWVGSVNITANAFHNNDEIALVSEFNTDYKTLTNFFKLITSTEIGTTA